jgi:hypothetical protein
MWEGASRLTAEAERERLAVAPDSAKVIAMKPKPESKVA